tara:strand:+ start:7187 stop:7729 length:543 start_codon:yes stop_codon:yes gene_type:complete
MEHTKIITPQYACFDQKTGEIFSIGPSIEDGYQYIEVSQEEIEPIKSYKEKMTDYIVAYNRNEKRFVLRKNIYLENEIHFTEILPVDESIMYDLLLTVDKTAKKCYINTGIELIDTMKTTNVDLQKEITFSFTKKGDPHVLYDTVTFNITDPKKAKVNIRDTYSVYASSDMATCMYRELK